MPVFTPNPTPLQRWREAATIEERAKMAALAKTTPESLRQMAKAYRTGGKARITPGLARLIEMASRELVRDGLPVVYREELSPECGQCEYAKQIAAGRG